MEQEVDSNSYIDVDIEEADEAHSNVGVYANLEDKTSPFSNITSSFDEPNLSTQLYNAVPSVFRDDIFGLFNRAITQPIIDTADAAIRTVDAGMKGFATGVNELKNLYTGEDDDRLKRDIYGFFTAGSPAAVTRPVNVAGRVKQLIDKGETVEAGKLMYSQVGTPMVAMTKKAPKSMAMVKPKQIDSTKEVPPLEIGVSKFALDGKLKSNLNKDSIKLFEDKAKGATAGSSKANKLIGVSVKDGEKVGIRKNLNSKSLDGEKGVLQTIHQNNYNGKALSYQPYATVENVIFNVNQSHRRRIASKAKGLAVPESSAKFNMASVDGNYVSNKNLLRDGYETEIAFNPAQGHLFIDVNTGQAVKGAKTATVVGDRVFANGVTYWKKADAPKPLDASDGTKLTGEVRYKFKAGGLVKQKGLMTR